MRLGFMQPYFLPYPGYFAVIAQTDQWVVFDDAQMIRHGWVDRNRVLHPTEGWSYIKVPTAKHSRRSPIAAVQASRNVDWRDRMLRQLAHYRAAPNFAPVLAWLTEALATCPDGLAALNVHMLQRTCDWLGLAFHPVLHSSLDYDRSTVAGPGDWAPTVAGLLGATTYLNPTGGAALFDPARFAQVGCVLRFVQWPAQPYPQLRPEFQPGLSILDMMLMLDASAIRDALLAAPQLEPAHLAAPS